jgi:two-component system phosphate regulon sensor histidine kinase PhoR
MKKNEHRWWGLVSIVIVLTSIALATTAAFFVTSFIYQRTGINPSALPAQIINSILGILFLVLIVGISSYIFRSKRLTRQIGMFGPIIEAMERMAKGDFNIRLEPLPGDDPLSELSRSVNNMAVELNQMETMRQEFISNVSHELQSPLTSIRGFARALQDETLSAEDRQHYLSIIETESVRLSKLTENLLELATLDSEHVKFDPALYRLDRQLRTLILACEPQWSEKTLEMDVTLDEVSLVADEDLLSEVWVNLLHNSIKFTPPGGKISVTLCQQAGQVEVTIKDTGVGISVEDQERVFERFFKSDRARDRAKGGSGLGLSIARKIVDLHKGTIKVESRLGEGAVFTVSLPVE